MKSKTKAGFAASLSPSVSNGTKLGVEKEKRPEGSLEGDTRILLVDDHPVLRKGLMACFENRPNLQVVGEAADGFEAVRRVGELRPDLVLMDVEMPRMDGLAATKIICTDFPQTKVLILSMHNKPEYMVQAVQMGARGFALKSLPSEELIKAIEIVQRGEPFFNTTAPIPNTPPVEVNVVKNPDELFEREKEVLVHLAAGYGNREIAELLSISVRTVESHRARLMKKLNIHTIAGLTRYAVAHGLISLEPDFPMGGLADPALQIAAGLRL